MSKSARRLDLDSVRTRGRFLIVGLAIFLILDAVLIVPVLDPWVPVSSDSEQPTQDPILDPQADTAPEATQPSEGDVPTVAPAPILAAGDEHLARRATTRVCGATALPELTTDTGISWKAAFAPPATGILSLQSIVVEGQLVASMIGQDSVNCSALLVRIFVAGDTYAENAADLDKTRCIDPLDHTIAVPAPGPCGNVLVLAPRWDAQAAAVRDDDDSVDGSALTPHAATVTGACIQNLAEPSALAGQIAVSAGSGAMRSWADDVTVCSLDEGATWV